MIKIKNKKKETVKISVRILKEDYEKLCKLSTNDNKGISQIVRDFIEDGLKIKANTEDIEKITAIIKKQMEIVCVSPIDRMIKIIIKNIKSTEANKQVTYELLKEFTKQNSDEIIEKAEQLAGVYASNKL